MYSIILALLYPFEEAILQKNHFFLIKVWWLLFFVIPLHSLLRQAVYLLVVNKASFFEKIYIDREVVQEASVWFYIKWMGKRNEPINSLSLLLRHCLKIIKEQKKRCFLLDTFRISVLKQRLLGGVLGVNVVFIITYHLSLITKTYFTMESLILAQDER